MSTVSIDDSATTAVDDAFDAGLTAFILVKTRRAWLKMTVPERVTAFETDVAPIVRDRVRGVRSRFYDTEFYTARVTDVWVWEARPRGLPVADRGPS